MGDQHQFTRVKSYVEKPFKHADTKEGGLSLPVELIRKHPQHRSPVRPQKQLLFYPAPIISESDKKVKLLSNPMATAEQNNRYQKQQSLEVDSSCQSLSKILEL